jgi:AcrR family transcriptional regulator
LNGVDGAAEWKLPRGRHRLPPGVVAEHQRARLLVGAAEAVRERGFRTLAVRDVIERAGVSRTSFYKLFDDLQGCLLAAHGDAFERLIARVSDACVAQEEWPDGVAAAVGAGIEFSLASPARAHLIAAADSSGDPPLARRALAARNQLTGLLRAGRQHCADAAALPDVVEQALIGGTVAVIGTRLIEDRLDRLPELKPELAQLLLTPYLGAGRAERVALAG